MTDSGQESPPDGKGNVLVSSEGDSIFYFGVDTPVIGEYQHDMEEKVNIFKYIASTFLVVLPCTAMADTGKHCSYQMDFGLSNTDTKAKQEEYSLRGCKKGDVVHIYITDADKLSREAMFMAGEIAEICDNKLTVTIVSADRVVCTYRGSRRSIRRSE